jgi:cell wall-associated NlpC family hydrolase
MPTLAPLRRLVVLPLLTLVVLLGASLLGPVGAASAAGGRRIDHASDIAVGQLGDPYRYGAAGPSAFDCSGLIYYSFRRAGVSVPRTSSAQAGRARHIRKSSLRRGDLMFFHNGGHVYHVAMFLRWNHGRALMLHSPHTGSRVQRATPWTSSWFAGTLRG